MTYLCSVIKTITIKTKKNDKFSNKINVMTTEQLKATIEARYQSKRAFVADFNETVEFAALDETTLSRQLSGNIGISKFAAAAYTLFFLLK